MGSRWKCVQFSFPYLNWCVYIWSVCFFLSPCGVCVRLNFEFWFWIFYFMMAVYWAIIKFITRCYTTCNFYFITSNEDELEKMCMQTVFSSIHFGFLHTQYFVCVCVFLRWEPCTSAFKRVIPMISWCW